MGTGTKISQSLTIWASLIFLFLVLFTAASGSAALPHRKIVVGYVLSRDQATKLGVSRYLRKPIDKTDLLDTVQHVLSQVSIEDGTPWQG